MNEIVVYSLVFLVVGFVLAYVIITALVLKPNREVLSEVKAKLEEEIGARNRVIAEKEQFQKDLLVLQSDHHHTCLKLDEQQRELENLNKKLTVEFENIANQVMAKNSAALQNRHEEKLKDLLNPFKEKLASFETKIEQKHKENLVQHVSIKEQLLQLKELNQHIGNEAKNLTQALKGNKKLQGNWGENSLERIVQAAGLEKGKHYEKESNLKTEDNENLRPDFIIFLPDEKNIIIDSKVSLIAYSNYFNAETKEEAQTFAQQHVQNLKNHISGLSDKKYQNLEGINSPDYVLMYMPIDAALALGMSTDVNLFDYALKKNIVLVSNSSLLATLKTVAFIWRQDLQTKNAMEIAKHGAALYDKFVGFVETLTRLGKKLKDANTDYDKAFNQLSEGKGNLIRKTEQLKALGLKPKKVLRSKMSITHLEKSVQKKSHSHCEWLF